MGAQYDEILEDFDGRFRWGDVWVCPNQFAHGASLTKLGGEHEIGTCLGGEKCEHGQKRAGKRGECAEGSSAIGDGNGHGSDDGGGFGAGGNEQCAPKTGEKLSGRSLQWVDEGTSMCSSDEPTENGGKKGGLHAGVETPIGERDGEKKKWHEQKDGIGQWAK